MNNNRIVYIEQDHEFPVIGGIQVRDSIEKVLCLIRSKLCNL